MNAFRAAIVLALGLAVIGSAYGGPPKGPPEPSDKLKSPLVWIDSAGEVVGRAQVALWYNEFSGALIYIDGDYAMAPLVREDVAPGVTWGAIDHLWFEAADCSGPAYLNLDSTSPGMRVTATLLSSSTGDSLLHIAAAGTAISRTVHGRRSTYDDACAPQTYTLRVLPVEKIVNLTTTYPPPLRLQSGK